MKPSLALLLALMASIAGCTQHHERPRATVEQVQEIRAAAPGNTWGAAPSPTPSADPVAAPTEWIELTLSCPEYPSRGVIEIYPVPGPAGTPETVRTLTYALSGDKDAPEKTLIRSGTVDVPYRRVAEQFQKISARAIRADQPLFSMAIRSVKDGTNIAEGSVENGKSTSASDSTVAVIGEDLDVLETMYEALAVYKMYWFRDITPYTPGMDLVRLRGEGEPEWTIDDADVIEIKFEGRGDYRGFRLTIWPQNLQLFDARRVWFHASGYTQHGWFHGTKKSVPFAEATFPEIRTYIAEVCQHATPPATEPSLATVDFKATHYTIRSFKVVPTELLGGKAQDSAGGRALLRLIELVRTNGGAEWVQWAKLDPPPPTPKP